MTQEATIQTKWTTFPHVNTNSFCQSSDVWIVWHLRHLTSVLSDICVTWHLGHINCTYVSSVMKSSDSSSRYSQSPFSEQLVLEDNTNIQWHHQHWHPVTSSTLTSSDIINTDIQWHHNGWTTAPTTLYVNYMGILPLESIYIGCFWAACPNILRSVGVSRFTRLRVHACVCVSHQLYICHFSNED